MATLKPLLVKRPFTRVRPERTEHLPVSDIVPVAPVREAVFYDVLTQSDFLREYHPTGHIIYNDKYYPDRYRKDPETGRVYKERVVRCAFAFQQLIALKHTITLCGNDIQFSLAKSKATQTDSDNFYEFMRGWETRDMEIAWYEAVRAAMIVADVAFVGYMQNGEFRWKVLSFLNGDTLYPHFDPVTGRLSSLARLYRDLDEQGNETCRYVELWDESRLYRFREQRTGFAGAVNKVKELFGLDGYELVSEEAHGFPGIPVAYFRTDGPAWQFSQDTIEQYELAFSYMCQNNLAFAFPIMYLKGDEVEIVGDPLTDSVKTLRLDSESDAGFLNPPDGSNNFTMQLTRLYDLILEQSSIAKVPEVKSGDLPGVAVKLLFSPSIERAMEDAQHYKPFLNEVVQIFKWGYGIERARISAFSTLPISFYIEPYVHMNTSELVTNLATSVQNGFLSRETASERIRMYATPQEYDRIVREFKKEQEADILAQLDAQAQQTNTENTDNESKEE